MLSRNKNKIQTLILTLAMPSFLIAPAQAADNTALEAQKQDKQQQLIQLNQQINTLNDQLKSKRQQAASLKNEVSLYNLEIQETQLHIQATQTNIENTNLQIQETQNEINDKTAQIEAQKKVLSELINNLNQYQNSSSLQLSLGSGNFSDILDQVQYTASLQGKVYALVQQIKDLKTKLQQDQQALQTNLDQLNQLNSQLQKTNITLNDERSGKIQLLSKTQGQESQYQKLLNTTQDQEAKVNQEIYNLDQQIQGKKGFNSLQPIHGILAYPIDGVMTQGYGNTGFTQLGYTFHNGIDIAAPPGTAINAAADGVVYATGKGETAYGNWVVIKHTITTASGHQIMTLYGHMISFVVAPGHR
jgi:murein DD-endopeptidase MepM/ murein hydrolase activator NlpD